MVDVETTGLDAQKNEIIEMGFVTFEDKAPFKIIKTYNTKVKPEHPETGSPRAFEVNGYKPEEWENAPSLAEALREVGDIPEFKKSTLMSYNISFDWVFLDTAFNKLRAYCPFDYHRLDLFTVAWMNIPHEEMPRWKLSAVCEKLGVPPEPEIHRALNGAMAGYEVYRTLMNKQAPLPL